MTEVCYFSRFYQPDSNGYDEDYFDHTTVILACNNCGNKKDTHFSHSIEIINTWDVPTSRPNLVCTIRFNIPLCNPTIENGEKTEFIGKANEWNEETKIRKLTAKVTTFEFTPTTDDSDLLFFEPFIPNILEFFELKTIDTIKEEIRKKHHEFLSARKARKGKAGKSGRAESDKSFVVDSLPYMRTIKDEICSKLTRVNDSKIMNDVCQTFAQVIFRHTFSRELGPLSTAKECAHYG